MTTEQCFFYSRLSMLGILFTGVVWQLWPPARPITPPETALPVVRVVLQVPVRRGEETLLAIVVTAADGGIASKCFVSPRAQVRTVEEREQLRSLITEHFTNSFDLTGVKLEVSWSAESSQGVCDRQML